MVSFLCGIQSDHPKRPGAHAKHLKDFSVHWFENDQDLSWSNHKLMFCQFAVKNMIDVISLIMTSLHCIET
jgi:hypothetical protein